MKLLVRFSILFCFIAAYAAPYNGEEVEFSQPDGSNVTVLLFGDEYHIDAESPDGYTLIRDEEGWICYAKLSADGNEYVSTGTHYTGKGKSIAPSSVRKSMRINSSSIREKRQKKREALGNGENESRLSSQKPSTNSSGFQSAPLVNDTTFGMVLIINYPESDKKSSLTKAQVEDALNNPNNSNSMWSYYYDISNGKVWYKNIFSVIVTVDKSYSYYDDDSDYRRVPELITNALLKLKAAVERDPTIGAAFDKITTYTRSNRKTSLVLNILHAHNPRVWAKGTWSHRGWYNGGPPGDGSGTANVNPAINGVYFYDYNLSALSGSGYNTMPISTMLHENGHMLMGWPDLYNYDSSIKNYVGSYDIMSSGTAMPNPYFRDKAGWITVTDITNMNATLSHVANSHTAYVYKRNNNEMYYIEARARNGRSANIPGAGLIVWHIHTQGDNSTLKANNPYPQIMVVQSNATTNDWLSWGNVGANNPFVGPARATFSQSTMPAAQYYDKTNSPINVWDVSAAGATMTFKIGTGGTGILSSSSQRSSSSVAVSSSSRSSSSRAVSSSSSNSGSTPILLSQIAIDNIRVQATSNFIVLENLPGNVKVEVYSLQGKCIYSGNSENSQILKVPVQTKGMYITNVQGSNKGVQTKVIVK